MNALLLTDGYKLGHHKQYPEGTTLVFSNLTPRSGKHSNSKKVVVFGTQLMINELHELFEKNFFSKDKIEVLEEVKKEFSLYLGEEYDVSHFRMLHELGYLPVEIRGLDEGTLVDYKTPVITIHNTVPEFYWVTNFLETIISNFIWKPMTSATTAFRYKKLLIKYALETDKENVGFVEFQGHDFSMRGMDSVFAVIASALGHATSFLGSDSLPAIHGARYHYNETESVIHSVNATEHSVMCAGGKEDEIETFRRLLKTYPTGILSVVSDTWDLWKVLTEYLPQLKEEILSRDGKLVIRPDSGDPVDIICGYLDKQTENYFEDNGVIISPDNKGVIELLWDIFGGTVNEQGYKVLDPHIGAIYGDSITLDRAKQICERLKSKGFASTNIVLGIGSFTYQYNTRDTHGFAVKATYIEKKDGTCNKELGHPSELCEKCSCVKGHNIFKDPATDDGVKKSAKGLLAIIQGEIIQETDWETVNSDKNELKVRYINGKKVNQTTFTQIRNKLNDHNIY